MKNNMFKSSLAMIIVTLNILLVLEVILIFKDKIINIFFDNEQTIETYAVISNEEEIGTQNVIEEEKSIKGTYSHEEYQSKIDKIAKKYGTVGLSVALVDNGEVIDSFSYGYAIKGQLPMTDDIKIRIASLSKIYVGLATMISVKNGTMDLDENIGSYWGINVKTSSSNDIITPRSILTHTSSLSDTEDISATYYSNMKNRLKSGSGIRNLISGNIKNYCYNNYAIDVLGMTIEIANKKTIGDVLSESLYQKMDIDAPFYAGDVNDTSKLATIYRSDGSVGYSASKSASLHKSEYASKGWAFAGGVTTSVKDLGKIVALISNDGVYEGVRYLDEKSIDELEYHENNKIDSECYWQCQPLCYQTNIYNQKELYYHLGTAYGVYNLACYNPDTKQGVAVLTSGASGESDKNDIYSVCGEIANELLNIGE